MPTQPNILYLHSHDTGRYIQPYGYAVATPHLQQLAEEGVLFRQAFCASPTCSPSRAALLTGMMPHNNGMLGLAHLGFSLNDYSQHVLHTLRKVGYTSALAGTQHIDNPFDNPTANATRIGYDHLLARADQLHQPNMDSTVQRAAEFLRNPPAQPFFLDVGFNETHRAYPEPEVNPAYVRPPAPIPDTPETRRDMASFISAARQLDEKMGAVLRALDESSLAENTLVVCTTDHGIAFPGMKCTLTNQGTGVMLIVRGPGGFSGGQVVDAMVSHLDIFPTLCELAGAEKPDWLQGSSLLPLVNGQAQRLHEAIFSEVTYHAAYEPMRAVRTARFNLILRYETRFSPVLPNCDDSPSKQVWLDHGWARHAPQDEQLFDLVFDPNEAHNLADDPAYGLERMDLMGRLFDWMKQTHDPLIEGQVPLPAGYPIASADALSPNEIVFPPQA